MLDSALSCCGFPKVLSVTGQTHQFFAGTDLPGGMDVEDFATAYIRCEGGLTIVLEVSWAGFHEHFQEAFMHVYGTGAGAHRRTFFDEHWNATTRLVFSRRCHGGTSTEQVDVMPGGLVSVQEDLVQAIIDDREPVCTLEQGLVVMEILDAIYESARTGKEVTLRGGRSA
jgi:predicted dehydrogenase